MTQLYEQLFRRKSFHRFTKPFKPLTTEQLDTVKQYFSLCEPLVENIRTLLCIVPVGQTTCRQGEYALLLYSERRDGYLQNIGYLGEQLNLFLTKENIGACWYGMGKPKEREYEGLHFVCMLCIANQDEGCFRTKEAKLNRLDAKDIWEGEDAYHLAPVVRMAPSACNTQPWLVKEQDNTLSVHRVFRKRGIIPPSLVPYYQSIDIGIFLFFLEVAMEQAGLPYKRTLLLQEPVHTGPVLTATYLVNI
ncbi:Putative TM nitroreductase [Sphaerochaeta associata]|nr:Putative TM nitroreductase [Sphaerochaeta associata]